MYLLREYIVLADHTERDLSCRLPQPSDGNEEGIEAYVPSELAIEMLELACVHLLGGKHCRGAPQQMQCFEPSPSSSGRSVLCIKSRRSLNVGCVLRAPPFTLLLLARGTFDSRQSSALRLTHRRITLPLRRLLGIRTEADEAICCVRRRRPLARALGSPSCADPLAE